MSDYLDDNGPVRMLGIVLLVLIFFVLGLFVGALIW